MLTVEDLKLITPGTTLYVSRPYGVQKVTYSGIGYSNQNERWSIVFSGFKGTLTEHIRVFRTEDAAIEDSITLMEDYRERRIAALQHQIDEINRKCEASYADMSPLDRTGSIVLDQAKFYDEWIGA